MNDIEQTKAEVAHFGVVDRYISELLAKPSSLSEDERTLIAGNIRGFYAAVFKWDSGADDLLQDAEAAIEEYSSRTPVSHIASEMETLAARLRAYRQTEKRRYISDAQKYLDALESIDAVAVDFGHFESAARSMQEIARKALGFNASRLRLADRSAL
ncbi:hypothetical protein [Mesorhizobium sp. Root172]|uniref:hypothetical protein n=1 Tax=Mesorhizobium sp. Root172 TaxID=1736481 RepID=UPI0006F35498|nr:hypothetical protein [Mesorhizobium sp. Root172]KRB22711.1 hypothetical protein ASE05_16145 [Mesorhizobium sp. Root172]